MRLRVLGCHGGESPNHRATAFVIDDVLALDAGSLARGLTLEEQCRLDHVILSHSHLDHVRDVALLADNMVAEKAGSLHIHCAAETADALRKHLFNNVIWPDFTKIPNPKAPEQAPTVIIHELVDGDFVTIGDYRVRIVPTNHTVPSHAIIVGDATSTLAYSADTGPTDAYWKALAEEEQLKAMIHEVSFPNDMKWLAEVSGHLTPEMLGEELQKLDPKHANVPVYLYHLKPGYEEVMEEELKALGHPSMAALKPLDEYSL